MPSAVRPSTVRSASSSSSSSSVPAALAASVRRNPLVALPYLTDRDRQILALLDQHRVLTTDQLRRVFFTSTRRCQTRLRRLHALGMLDRFRYASPRYGLGQPPWKWTLGLAGARFQAAATGRPTPTDRAHRDRVLRLGANPALPHLTATNELFVRLLHHARTTPDARMLRWWSEPAATAAFLGIHPDGHLLWTAHGATVGAFVEVDLGTEDLPRLSGKLPAYARLTASGGPRYPVLFWLPTRQREINLRRHLTALATSHDPTAAAAAAVPVATAIHDDDPAGPVWLPTDSWHRVRLTDLPSDHGPDTAHNPNWRSGHLDLT